MWLVRLAGAWFNPLTHLSDGFPRGMYRSRRGYLLTLRYASARAESEDFLGREGFESPRAIIRAHVFYV